MVWMDAGVKTGGLTVGGSIGRAAGCLKGAFHPIALIDRQFAFKFRPLVGQFQQPLAAALGSLTLGYIAVIYHLPQNAAQTLLGDLQNTEKLGHGHAGSGQPSARLGAR